MVFSLFQPVKIWAIAVTLIRRPRWTTMKLFHLMRKSTLNPIASASHRPNQFMCRTEENHFIKWLMKTIWLFASCVRFFFFFFLFSSSPQIYYRKNVSRIVCHAGWDMTMATGNRFGYNASRAGCWEGQQIKNDPFYRFQSPRQCRRRGDRCSR